VNPRFLPLALLLLATAGVRAQDQALPDPGPPPDAPADVPLPPKELDSSARLEPTVTISTDESGQVIEEYRVQGAVYMVKVTPTTGVPYYLFDSDGDGSLETRWTEVQGVVDPVYYPIKEWK